MCLLCDQKGGIEGPLERGREGEGEGGVHMKNGEEFLVKKGRVILSREGRS